MLQLYKNIKTRRTQLKITQAELAQKLGYADKSMISKIESGKVDLPLSKIIEFANILHVDASELMGNDGVNLTPDHPSTLAAHFDGEEYTEDEMDEIRNFAEFVKNKRK